jgi:hypothetical protein
MFGFGGQNKIVKQQKARRNYKAYEGSDDVSLTPHPEDELDRDVEGTDRMVLNNGEGWPCRELGELNGSSYGELRGRGAGARSPTGRNSLSNTPACEKGYRGTPTSKGCF